MLRSLFGLALLLTTGCGAADETPSTVDEEDATPGSDGDGDLEIDGGTTTACHTGAPAESFLTKVDETPDYAQRDPAFGGFADGSNFCGPAAVSNSLVWLSHNGYPAILPVADTAAEAQHDLIVTLASPTYFDTSGILAGTPPSSLITGLAQFLDDRDVTYERLLWHGWNIADEVPELLPNGEIPPAAETGIATPDVDSIKLGVEGRSSTWLLLGLGSHEADANEHIIRSGHWVTVTGHRRGEDGADFMIVHDPWTEGEPSAEQRLVPIDGELVIEVPQAPSIRHTAVGFLRLVGPWGFSHSEVTLLGAVTLDVDCD